MDDILRGVGNGPCVRGRGAQGYVPCLAGKAWGRGGSWTVEGEGPGWPGQAFGKLGLGSLTPCSFLETLYCHLLESSHNQSTDCGARGVSRAPPGGFVFSMQPG